MAAKDEEWDLDSDEIRSIDSEELYETRPNRWKGHPSTWNAYTEEERFLHRSLETIRNRNLSVHLYNVFALKNRATLADASKAAKPAHAEPDEAKEEAEDEFRNWKPPSRWTAWPMNVKHVPSDDFMKEMHDEDDDYTTRAEVPQMPSTALGEEVTAAILKQAKERFMRRQKKYEAKQMARANSAPETTAASSPSAYSAPTTDAEEMAEDAQETNAPQQAARMYEPVVSADDELSTRLLRPSVRHILTTLDNTLTTLHNGRLAGLSYMTDSSASATDVSDASEAESISSVPSVRRSRSGRPRSKAPRTPPPPQPARSRSGSRRGRPRKVHTPLPGESERDMLIRIAREQKKRIPFSSDEEGVPVQAPVQALDVKQSIEQHDTEGEEPRSSSPRKKREPVPPENKIKWREHMLGQWGLRDWSDVMGAAAISGFKPEVIARATQRCADLFGQGMDMQTLHEGPAVKGPKARRVRYLPSQHPREALESSSEEKEEEEEETVVVRRRQRSAGRDSVPPPSGSERERTPGTPGRARSSSRSSSVGVFYCTVAGCPRAEEGFGKRANLERHVARVHPGRKVEVDEESDGEMFGAVHVDGFMKPIRARKGWRAEDTGVRKRKRHYRGRRVGSETSGGEGTSAPEGGFYDST
ncbi:hypothetical protein C8034_v009727 [Colletotrichum sidae]|uniref:Rrn9 domain-containing protein n=1 Tax=Colletotrichum sidae TaxID=1347389 RepID=A0A4V6QE98_9PEZI|nr:hypothetical protein C8034_v009727 [Colletotrichum sidae]